MRAELARVVEAGPNPAVVGLVRWRLVDLCAFAHRRFGVSISPQAMSDTLRDMGFRKLSARPQHYAADPAAAATFKKNFSAALAEIAQGAAKDKDIEIWFQSLPRT